jgi:hypothetical protein
MSPFIDSIDHLQAELARVDLLIRRALFLAPRSGTPKELRGLVISEPEVRAALDGEELPGERWRAEDAHRQALAPMDEQIAAHRAAIDRRRDLARRADRRLALPYLAGRFALSPAEVDVLLLALAPEVETRYETLYALLQNDMTRKRPSADLALNLICRNEREKYFARRILAPDGALIRHRLIELIDEPQDRQPTLLRKFLRVDEPVVRFLLDQPPGELGPGRLRTPQHESLGLEVSTQTCARLANLAICLRREESGAIVVRLVSDSEPALCAAADALAHALGRRVLAAELAALGDEARVAALLRDAVLWRAALAITAPELPSHEADAARLAHLAAQLGPAAAHFPEPLLLLGPASALAQIPQLGRAWRVEVEPPDYALRCTAWTQALNGRATEADTARLADSLFFGARQIDQIIDAARGLAALRDPAAPAPSIDDLLEAGRTRSTPTLERLAIRLEPRFTWSDIVLPDQQLQQLRSIAARMKHRRLVLRDWGFGRKLSRGKGLSVLFTGPSGVGKTMAAEILAGALGLGLHQIDLSCVVSKYIGETEKNLSQIFREAEQCQTILFFDEADALFGKRTEIKDAHDRYANIEVNYLLQRVEQYDGVVILSTNLQKNLDESFLRRLQEVVDFPMPDQAQRERIWRGLFPDDAPRDDDIDFEFLARQFKLSGGSIKNIVLAAAYQAAQQSGSITMTHLILATRTEFQKQGKLSVKNDFGPYFDLIRSEAPS